MTFPYIYEHEFSFTNVALCDELVVFWSVLMEFMQLLCVDIFGEFFLMSLVVATFPPISMCVNMKLLPYITQCTTYSLWDIWPIAVTTKNVWKFNLTWISPLKIIIFFGGKNHIFSTYTFSLPSIYSKFARIPPLPHNHDGQSGTRERLECL